MSVYLMCRYFCSIDGSGCRLDRDSKAELSRGTVDFKVNADYCVRPMQVRVSYVGGRITIYIVSDLLIIVCFLTCVCVCSS